MQDERLHELEQKVKSLEEEVLFLKKQNEDILKQLSTFSEQPKTAERRPNRPAPSPTKKEAKPVDWETVIGQIWLPRIFVFVLLLGIVWGFKVASDIGMLSPSIKSLLGFFAGGALLLLAHKQMKRQRRALGLVLYGGAVSVFMLTTFAIHVLYHFIPAPVAFILNMIWIATGIVLANKHRSQVLGIFVGIGGYLVPFLLESENPNLYIFACYEVLLYFSLLLFSLRKRFVWLYIASAGLLHAAFLAYAVILFFHSQPTVFALQTFAAAVFAQHVLLLAAFLKKTLYMREQMTTVFASFTFSTVWLLAAFDDREWLIRLFFLSFFAGYAFLAYLFHQKDAQRQNISLAVASFALFALLMHEIDERYAASFLLAEGALSLFLGMKLRSVLQQVTGGMIYLIGSVFVMNEWIREALSIETVHWLVWLATLAFLANAVPRPIKHELQKIPFIALVAVLFLFASQMSIALTQPLSEHVQQMALSFTWAVFAVLSAVFGTRRENKAMRVGGIVLLFLTLLKLIFIDLPIVSLLIRSILFIGLGGIGIFMSRLFYKNR